MSQLKAQAGQPVTDVAALYREAAAPYVSWQRVAREDNRMWQLHDSQLEQLLLGNMVMLVGMNELVWQSGLRHWQFYVQGYGRVYEKLAQARDLDGVIGETMPRKALDQLMGRYLFANREIEDKRWRDWFARITERQEWAQAPIYPDTWIGRGMAEHLLKLASLRQQGRDMQRLVQPAG
jgi:hypothetical protein